MKLNQIQALVALSVLVSGCGESNGDYFKRVAAYREARNPLREQKNIPVIPGNWVVRADRSAVAWDNPDFTSGKGGPLHHYKFLRFTDIDSGTILAETDHYESGKRWDDLDAGTLHECLDITYSFDLERQGSPPWAAELRRLRSSGPEQISLAEAEQVLKSWGIERLEFNRQGHQIAQPDGAATRGQPVSSKTNRTSAAAGPGG